MTFGEAMDVVANGGRVTKQEWGNTTTYLALEQGYLRIFKADDKEGKALMIRDGDLFGQDWMEI